MNKHTPGPWHVGHRDSRVKECRVYDEADEYNEGSFICDCRGPFPWTMSMANAVLIAACPDLLAVAKAALNHLDAWHAGEFESEKQAARAAIAKAEGK
jgi:hypothetical protein